MIPVGQVRYPRGERTLPDGECTLPRERAGNVGGSAGNAGGSAGNAGGSVGNADGWVHDPALLPYASVQKLPPCHRELCQVQREGHVSSADPVDVRSVHLLHWAPPAPTSLRVDVGVFLCAPIQSCFLGSQDGFYGLDAEPFEDALPLGCVHAEAIEIPLDAPENRRVLERLTDTKMGNDRDDVVQKRLEAGEHHRGRATEADAGIRRRARTPVAGASR